MRARRVRITDTTLRDGHQSLWATRMRTQDMLPILETMDEAGFNSLECWGGATFDAMLRFLDEDPWERLRLIKKYVVRTPLQMLLRGQNIVGYRHYGDDIVRRFVYKAAENGMDIFRVFDALNDIRNFETAAAAIKETGKHFQGAVVYTISPVHSLDHYVDVARRLVEMGADSICIKDMAALLSPFYAEQLIGRLKAEIAVPIQLHCHYIGGLAPMTYLKAVEAGVDVIDTATVPLAFGNSQPATEMVVTALIGTPYDTELDLETLFSIAKYFEGVRKETQHERGVTSLTHMQVYSHQVPGGMISNLESQLKEQNALDRLPEVLEEIPVVRAEVGFPPLVTPMSQIVGTQAVLNVLSGRRWHIVPDEMKQYLRGRYGAAPGPVSEEVVQRVLGDEEPIHVRPADLVRRDARGLSRRDRRPGPLRRGPAQLRPVPGDGAHLPGAPPHRSRGGRVRRARPLHELAGGRGARRGLGRPCARHPHHGRAERDRRSGHRGGRPQGDGAQGRGGPGRRGAGAAGAGRGGGSPPPTRTPAPTATTSSAPNGSPRSTGRPRRSRRRSWRSATTSRSVRRSASSR